ncbi:Crp/Fnr family transcriptional regulator [Solihabitans fulvus]|uniref:Crp/Fnr family transcriptional regulator n=2 Tax=Solihabitans fulvus TaxID=1892852 RepID=A0A5B2WVN1_9PSEU|nr:Crp/Fnr family transcriptional regulator [Solihabitans fulvus]
MHSLPARDREALLRVGTPRNYVAGQSPILEGDRTTFALAILDGWAVVLTTTQRGRRMIFAIRGPGDIVGELSAIDGQPRSTTVSALSPLRTILMPGDRFRSFLDTHPATSAALMSHFSHRLRESDLDRRALASSTVLQRLARLLLELVEHVGTPTPQGTLVDLPLAQYDLAASIGSTREAMAKALRVLRERGIVHTHARRVLILHPDLLDVLAGD